MTKQEILNYFGTSTVYQFNGTLQELTQLQESDNNSYSYLVVLDVIYVSPQKPMTDSRATLFTGE